MSLRPPRSNRTDPPFPDTTLFRSAGDADAVPVLVVAGAVQPDAGRPDDEVHAIDDEVAHRDAGTPGARADAIAPAGVRAVLAAQEQLVRPVAFLEAEIGRAHV